ncbi:MAG: bifunctional hydroxymethylpyrimidine kinase/phosphomethylpyrimidine kinase [Chthoniobacterales bacterium]
MSFPSVPVVLSIAGSDNSAGAGIQADLKTVTTLGCYGLTAVTCVVSEIPGCVEHIQAIRPSIVASQVALCVKAFPIAAVKIGMLYSTSIMKAVLPVLTDLLERRGCYLVVDPVMISSSGDPLLQPDAISFYRKHIFPLARVITPNLDELSHLCKRKITSLSEMKKAGLELTERHGCAVLCKGGHLKKNAGIDLLVDGDIITSYEGIYRKNVSTHGSGCTYSSAIAAGLAKGKNLPDAVFEAKNYIQAAIDQTLHWGSTQALQHVPVRTSKKSKTPPAA